MFNVGGGEIIVILLLALIVLGPDKLPDAAKKVGKVVGDLKRLSEGFQQEMRQVADFRDDDAAPGTPNGPYLVGPPSADDGPATAAGHGDGPVTTPAPAATPAAAEAPEPPAPAAEPTTDAAPAAVEGADRPPTEQAGGSSAA